MNELTKDWLQLFNEDKAKGTLAKSIFWRLATFDLPEGVDPDNPEVIAAIEDIRQALNN